MRPYTDAEIKAYIESGDPMDKAGAYGIQGPGGALVDRIEALPRNPSGKILKTELREPYWKDHARRVN